MTILSRDQASAVNTIDSWSKSKDKDLTFGGLAGTGKTTILQHCWPFLQERGAVAVAPSGKAAEVLRQKGVPATTIHKLIYQFRGLDKDNDLEPIFVDHGTWSSPEIK